MTRLPTSLRVALYTFLYETPGGGVFTDHNGEPLPFDLPAFLAEALLSADDNDRASERAIHQRILAHVSRKYVVAPEVDRTKRTVGGEGQQEAPI